MEMFALRIIICDDHKIIIDTLKDFLFKYFSINKYQVPEIVCYQDGKSLINDKSRKDIIFLDIELPDINGIELGQILSSKEPNCIIMVITSYMEYLDDAMRFHVFRYISKPFDLKRLTRNLNDAISLFNSRNHPVVIETKEYTYTVNSSDIIAVEAVNRKIKIYTSKTELITGQNMNYWESILPQSTFFRTHRNFIVNLGYVTDFSSDTVHVSGNKPIVYLASRKYTSFKQAFLLYIEHHQ